MSGLFQDGISPRAKFGAAALIAAALVGFSAVVEVPESQQAVVMRWAIRCVSSTVTSRASISATRARACPARALFETLVRVDRRVLNLDMERQQVNSSDQQRLEVDAYARFRIIDPVKMVRTAGRRARCRNSFSPS
jgi:membrane protease subunit HflC